MEYYAFYSAPHELRDDFTDDFILYMEAYYPGYARIFFNTEKQCIRIIRNGRKETLQLSAAEEEMIRKKVMYDQAVQMVHTSLIKKLADRFTANTTIVFADILSMGQTPEQIWTSYEYFMRRNIYMEFVSGSAINTRTVLSLSSSMTPEIAKYIQTQITSYCYETERKQNMPVKLGDKKRLEKKELL